VGIAVGPVGRNAGVSGHIHGGELSSREGTKAPVAMAPCYAYSHSKGLFIGISLEGAVIKPRKDVNAKFYGAEVSAKDLLSGLTMPPAAADPLYEMLASGLSQDDDLASGEGAGGESSYGCYGGSASDGAPAVTGQPTTASALAAADGGEAASPEAAANPFTDGGLGEVAMGELHAERFNGEKANANEEFVGEVSASDQGREVDTGDAASAVEI